MSPSPSKATTHRRPLAVLPLDQFLSKSSPRSPRRPVKRSPAKGPLQLQDMSLLPSPFPSPSTVPARPLATLYEAPAASRSTRASRDASVGLASSPRARAMVDEDDTSATSATNDAAGGDDEPDALASHSSPRRLFDAFVAAGRANATGSPATLRKRTSTSSLSAAHFIAERPRMPPPASPRATGSPRTRLARPREPSPPNWSFYQDEEDDNAAVMPFAPELAASAPSPAATEGSDDAVPIDKENTAPPPRRARSSSVQPTAAPAAPSAQTPASGNGVTPQRETPATLPHTPPRPASPSLPFFSPAILGVVDAPNFADSGATSFFAAAGTMSASATTTAASGTTLVHAEITSTHLSVGLLPEAGVARKKRRSDEAGHAIPLP